VSQRTERQRIPNGRGHADTIIGMKISLPEAELILAIGQFVAKQAAEPLRPRKTPAFYIPIPNCIIRSPGNE
jgi:hypothetical protein